MSALEQAVKHSAANIEGFGNDTTVLLACDVSGSMCSPISPKSKVLLYDVGLMLAMLLKSRCKSVISGIFGDTWKVVNTPTDNILMSTEELRKIEGQVGYSTNGYKVIDYLSEKKLAVDKVMFFTDLQMWDSTARNAKIRNSWEKYKKMFPKSKLYLFDLAGYGMSPLKLAQPDVYLIAGWSDKVFDVLSAVDSGKEAVEVIKNVIV